MTGPDQKENAIKLIGDYLLKGWTLTDFGCCDCNTPIMRSRSGEEVCTFCSQNPIRKVLVAEPEAILQVLEEPIVPKSPKVVKGSQDSQSGSEVQSNFKTKLLNISQEMLSCKDYDQIKKMIDASKSLIELISSSQQL